MRVGAPRLVVALVAAVASGVAGTGCGGADNGYIENGDDALYLRLPGDWISYAEDEIYAEPLMEVGDAMSTLDVIRELESNWVVGFASEDVDTPLATLALASNVPIGYTAVIGLPTQAGESLDVVTQRSFGWPSLQAGGLLDPVAAFRDDPDGDVELLGYEEFDVPGRGTGTHVRAAFDGLGSDTVIRDVTVVADPLATELYVLSIGCYAQCFLTNTQEINDVVASFTLEELG